MNGSAGWRVGGMLKKMLKPLKSAANIDLPPLAPGSIIIQNFGLILIQGRVKELCIIFGILLNF